MKPRAKAFTAGQSITGGGERSPKHPLHQDARLVPAAALPAGVALGTGAQDPVAARSLRGGTDTGIRGQPGDTPASAPQGVQPTGAPAQLPTSIPNPRGPCVEPSPPQAVPGPSGQSPIQTYQALTADAELRGVRAAAGAVQHPAEGVVEVVPRGQAVQVAEVRSCGREQALPCVTTPPQSPRSFREQPPGAISKESNARAGIMHRAPSLEERAGGQQQPPGTSRASCTPGRGLGPAPGLTSVEGHPLVPRRLPQDGLGVVQGTLHGPEGHRAAGARLQGTAGAAAARGTMGLEPGIGPFSLGIKKSEQQRVSGRTWQG